MKQYILNKKYNLDKYDDFCKFSQDILFIDENKKLCKRATAPKIIKSCFLFIYSLVAWGFSIYAVIENASINSIYTYICFILWILYFVLISIFEANYSYYFEARKKNRWFSYTSLLHGKKQYLLQHL